MSDIDLTEARRLKAELTKRLASNERFLGIGLTVTGGRPAVQVNRRSGPPLSIESEIDGVPVLQSVAKVAKPL